MSALLLAPLRVEALALRPARGVGVPVVLTGAGTRRAAAAGRALDAGAAGRVVLAGVGGGCAPHAAPGDVVVATALLDADGGPDAALLPLADPGELVAALRATGATVLAGPVATSARVVTGDRRAAVAARGALAADTESLALARALDPRVPLAVVRVVVDTARAPLLSPTTPARGIAALRALRAIAPLLAAWAAPPPERDVDAAAPPSSSDLRTPQTGM